MGLGLFYRDILERTLVLKSGFRRFYFCRTSHKEICLEASITANFRWFYSFWLFVIVFEARLLDGLIGLNWGGHEFRLQFKHKRGCFLIFLVGGFSDILHRFLIELNSSRAFEVDRGNSFLLELSVIFLCKGLTVAEVPPRAWVILRIWRRHRGSLQYPSDV